MTIEKIIQVSCDICEDAFFLHEGATIIDALEEIRRYSWVTRKWDDGRPGKMHVCRRCAGRPEPPTPPTGGG